MTNEVAKIYVLHYKCGTVLDLPPLYSYLMAGNALMKGKSKILGDDSSRNISSKNKYYSELTGIYWIWKNTQNDITGACHYRRFFTNQPEPLGYRLKRLLYLPIGLYRKHFGLIYTSNVQLFKDKILSDSEMHALLEQYDAILPVARKLIRTAEVQYARRHDAKDLILLRKIINEKHPTYMAALDEVLQSKRLYANNMFVLRKNHFEEFMTWWFDILFEFEKQIDLKTKTGYQERILGFIAERLLNVWFAHKKLNVVELPIIYFKKFKKMEEYDACKSKSQESCNQ